MALGGILGEKASSWRVVGSEAWVAQNQRRVMGQMVVRAVTSASLVG